MPIFSLPPYTKEVTIAFSLLLVRVCSFDPQTRGFYMGIYLGNRSVQVAGTAVEEKAYDDWLDTLTRSEYGD